MLLARGKHYSLFPVKPGAVSLTQEQLDMDIEEANASLAVISQASSAIHQRSEQLRTKFKELYHAVSVWSNEQRQLDGQHADVCEHLCASNEGMFCTQTLILYSQICF